MRILLVDGSAPIRKSMKKLLAELREVDIIEEAETALAALAFLKTARPEVVILDPVLKCGRGFEVLKAAKFQPNAPLVIVLTNCVLPPMQTRVYQNGADFFFDKSHEFHKVVEVLKLEACSACEAQHAD